MRSASHVRLGREPGRHRDVPEIPDPALARGAGTRIPRPLMQGDEVDSRVALDEGLRAIPVMHVPVDNEHAIRTMLPPRVLRRERNIAEDAEAHRRITKRMMPRRTNRAKAAHGAQVERHVDGIEHAPGRRRGGEPRALTRHRIGIEPATACERNSLNSSEIFEVVHERQLPRRGMAAFVMEESHEELGAFPERARDPAEAPDVLRRAPACVVAPAIGVRDERGRHRAPRNLRDAHSASSSSASAANIHQRSPGVTCSAAAVGGVGAPRPA